LQSESHAPQLTWTQKQNQTKQHFQPSCFAIYTKERQISCFHMDFVCFSWNGPWWSFWKKGSGWASEPSLAVCWGWAEATPRCMRQHAAQGRGGGAAGRGQCTAGCAKQSGPGASVRTRLVRVLLAPDRLSGDRNS
jgi:hypothetical protein